MTISASITRHSVKENRAIKGHAIAVVVAASNALARPIDGQLEALRMVTDRPETYPAVQ